MESAFSFSLLALIAASSLFHLTDATTNSDDEFIRSNCASTLFPDRCYNSLFQFSDKIHHNPAVLARVAITVSLSWANHFTTHLNSISSLDTSVGTTNLFEVLKDCVSVFADATDQMIGSLQQMERLRSDHEMLRFDLSNVQTWMSSAITNEDTCMAGFNGVSHGEVTTDVVGRVAEVKEVTSNALSLVNSYVSKLL